MIKVKLNNDFEFEAESVNETRNISGNIRIVNINAILKDGEYTDKMPEITENITVANMSRFTVSADDKQICEYAGFAGNLIMTININKQGQSLYITINK